LKILGSTEISGRKNQASPDTFFLMPQKEHFYNRLQPTNVISHATMPILSLKPTK
jgi:hypothetical protein